MAFQLLQQHSWTTLYIHTKYNNVKNDCDTRFSSSWVLQHMDHDKRTMKWLPGFSKYCHIVQIVYKLFVTDGGDNKCNLHRKGKSFSYLYYISWLSNIDMYLCTQCGFKCLLGRNQKIETKLGCENITSQNTIAQLIGLVERLTF